MPRDLSANQRKIVDRYYENREGIATQNLQQLVSDLYLAEGKKAETLWGRAEKALKHVASNDAATREALASRDVVKLAAVVAKLK